MPEGYERSRARIAREYEDDRGDYGRPHGGGGGGRNRFVRIAIIAAAVVVVVVVVIIVKNMFGSVPSGGAQQTDSSMSTDSPAPTDTADALPTDTSQLDDTASTSPTDTVDPNISASPDPTVSTQPDDTASLSPTDTPDPTNSSSSGNSGSTTQLDVPAVEGKPNANVTDNLPMHSSASATSATVIKIPKDETFTVLAVSTTKTWLKVKYSDKTGYVLAKYVSIGSDGKSKVCTVTSTTINVRSGAGKTKDVIGTLKKDDTVVVESQVNASDGTWYKVVVGSTTGYVFAQNCRIDSV
jgi:cytoskeletal protein RodZ